MFTFLHRKNLMVFHMLLIGMLSVGLSTPVAWAVAEIYDLAILNGRVMDPDSGLDAVRHVGVMDDKISIITEDTITGHETIDAKGHVVAPGFIDTHVHIVDQPFGQKLMLRDGVTTPLDLEVGAYPVDRFYNTLESKSQTNYGATVSTIGIFVKKSSILNTTHEPVL
jgi:predicted amidohydrolase